MMSKRLGKQLLAGPFLLWMVAFTIIPLILMGIKGFTTAEGAFTLENILAMGSEMNIQALILSLQLSLMSTVICLLLAYPLAMILRKMGDSNSVIVFLFVLPMWMNFLLRTIAWQSLLEKEGVINGILTALHLPTIDIINTPAAIVLGMVYNFLPFMILPLYSVMSKIDGRLLEASADLGAGGLTTLRRVVFPLSFPGIVTGIIMVFIPAASTFVISQRLGDGSMLIGDLIETFFIGAYTNFGVGSAISLVLMVLMLIFIGVLNLFDNEDVGDMLI